MDLLIAEDDPVSALRLRRQLEGMGHVVRVAADGMEAWRVVRETSPSLVISDWVMPGLDGPELVRRIRELGGGRYTYTILLTGRDSREDRLEGLRSGADDYLTKPVDPAELAARLGIAGRILGMQAELQDQARRLGTLSAELEKQNAQLEHLVATDPLTGAWNRRYFQEALEAQTRLAGRHDRPVSLTMVDIDYFKAYNDAHGHPKGDEALRAVATELRGNVRSHDVVARYGGEEFVILQPEADFPVSVEIGERLRRAVCGLPWKLRQVTISVGVATWRGGYDPAELIERADRALYQAKARGRNCVVHDRDMPAPAGQTAAPHDPRECAPAAPLPPSPSTP